MNTLLLVLGYLAGWTLTWSAFLAQDQHDRGPSARKHYRDDLAMCMGMALIPAFWFMVPFFTGFFQHGFQIFPRKDTP